MSSKISSVKAHSRAVIRGVNFPDLLVAILAGTRPRGRKAMPRPSPTSSDLVRVYPSRTPERKVKVGTSCLLYTSDAADE